MKLLIAIATALRRTHKGTYWHWSPHVTSDLPALTLPEVLAAPPNGRVGVWYASNKEQGAYGVEPSTSLMRSRSIHGGPSPRRSSGGHTPGTDLTREDLILSRCGRNRSLCPTTTPPPAPSPPPAMPTSTPYWLPALPVVSHFAVFGFTHRPTSSPKGSEVRQPPRGSPTYSPLIRLHEQGSHLRADCLQR